ncbi:MAG: serine hydrolase domain-containing protein [Dokdonella sp.]
MNRITTLIVALCASFALVAGIAASAGAATPKPAKKTVATQKKSTSAKKPAAKATATSKAPSKKKVAAGKKSRSVSTKRTGASRGNQRVAAAKPQLVVAPEPSQVPIVVASAVARDLKPLVKDAGEWIGTVGTSPQIAGLAIAIVKDNDIVFEKGVGVVDKGPNTPVLTSTVFRLASLSKAFASTLAGLLVRDGVIQWDTRIVELMPTFALADTAGESLTVRDIMSQRAGLPHNAFDRDLEGDEPYPMLVDKLRSVPLACPVGECYAYQNVAFSLIGDVTYAATGDFFYYQVEKRLFHPLHMDTATYGREALESSASWARPHVRSGGGWRAVAPKDNYYRVPPAAGVNASINDMAQWLIAQMGGRPDVLPAVVLDELHKPLVDTPRELRSSPWRRGRLTDAHYGLGWRVFDYAGETMIFHGGAVQGYRSLIAFLPKYRFGMVMLWNNEAALPSGLMPMVMDRYLGLPATNWAGIDSDDNETAVTGSGD